MHFAALLKKWNYSLTGKIYLSDAVRNFAYEWAWSFLRRLPAKSALCDIGSRDSLFPVFLAWRGLKVDIVEKDERFARVQRQNSKYWRAPVEMHSADFLAFDPPGPFSAICSLFSLQHAGPTDVDCYARAAEMLAPGGLFLSACEYDHTGTRHHDKRDDGAMSIYGPDDVARRMEHPLIAGGLEIIDRRFAGFIGPGKSAVFLQDPRGAAFFYVCAGKK
jgi:hypothetical protein